MKSPHLAALAAALALSGCGGGGPPPVVATDLLVIGNSITKHDALPDLGWYGTHGMAASSEAADFAHQIGTSLGLPVTALNVSYLERDPGAPVPSFPVTNTTVVVVELGDNGLPAKYAEIMGSVRGAAKLACVSTWWVRPDRDAVIRAECEKVGGSYVYIGDLYPASEDPVGTYPDHGVDIHPQDWGMRKIAERVAAALSK